MDALTLTNRMNRVVFTAQEWPDGTYSYHAVGAGGMSMIRETVLERAVMHKAWNPSATATGPLASEFENKIRERAQLRSEMR